ncbi:molecular chaperone HtpG [Flavobacteriales bacterium]|nr:molecular chaperone HtpG [Flavobacteriales bacterium]MDC1370752.1 molecular chaperone HtpG [Flavobacteriales bacterium]
MATGKINVQTENIFPIIKKFLYSDTEIFLRELVSNAVDASQKLKTLSSLGEFKGEVGKLQVEVILDKEAKTITIRDNGIGMTGEEVDKYINQIAFSGAEEFVQKYKDTDGAAAMIGHFGLGFYSSFMVSEKVEIRTLSHKEGSQAVSWTSDGTPEYTLEDVEKETRGTDIIMYVAEDSIEFLEEARINTILNKYCKFLPVDIKFGTKTEYIDSPTGEKEEDGKLKQDAIEVDNIINNTSPMWAKTPAELKEKDYDKFYQELYPMSEKPLFNIHLNVDYPFNLTGILYFPKLKKDIQIQKNKIQLYSNQVFITDSVENIVPEFMQLLHGVIDSPDIPLNVSRSYLQSDSNVKKISSYITKKVADKLNSMFKENREDFEQKWEDIKVFIEYGMLSDDKFNEKAKKFSLLRNTEGKSFTIDEYAEKVKETQKDKDDKVVYLYTNDTEEHHSLIENATSKGYDVLVLDGPLAPHLVSKLEQDLTNTFFARIDADTIEKLIDKGEEVPSKLTKEDEEALKPIIEEVVHKAKFTVNFQSLSETDSPMQITEAEFMRRMKEQQAMGGGAMGFMGTMPEMYNLVVNSNHPLISKILETKTDKKKKQLIEQATDLALLAKGMLTGKKLTEFLKRSIDIIK